MNPRSPLVPIVEIFGQYIHPNSDVLLIHQIRDYLRAKTQFNFTVDDYFGDSCLSVNTLKPNQREAFLQNIAPIQDQIEFEIIANDKTDTFQADDSKEIEYAIIIKKINPKIACGEEAIIASANENEIKTLDEKTPASHLNTDVDTSVNTPNLNSLAPVVNAIPVSHIASTIIKSKDLADIEKMRQLIVKADNLFNLRVEGIPLVKHVLMKFSKYKAIAEILMYENICRGNLNDLKTLLNITVEGQVKRSFTQFSKSYTESTKNSKGKTSSETHGYTLRANFDLKAFVEQVKYIKLNNSQHAYLGLQEDVENCIRLVCGNDNSKTTMLIARLATLNAYIDINNIMDFDF